MIFGLLMTVGLIEMHRYLDRKGVLGKDGGTEGRVQVLGMMGQKKLDRYLFVLFFLGLVRKIFVFTIPLSFTSSFLIHFSLILFLLKNSKK